jgi:hypothetical protein
VAPRGMHSSVSRRQKNVFFVWCAVRVHAQAIYGRGESFYGQNRFKLATRNSVPRLYLPKMAIIVIVMTVILSGVLPPPDLEAIRTALRERVLAREDLAVIQPVVMSIRDGGLVSARVMWDRCNDPSESSQLYTDELLLAREYGFLAIRHPENRYDTYGNLLAVDIADPGLNMNDMLMGPAGSGTLLHRDQPTPFATRMLVVYGRKEVVVLHCDVSAIPARIRSHRPGVPSYDAQEWEVVKAWVRQMGGIVHDLRPGKCVTCA